MKRELKKTIRQLCDEVGTAAAAEKMNELTGELTEEYDKRVQAGMAELDAYRDVLKDIGRIREMLESLPTSEEDEDRWGRETGRKNLERILSKISTCMWLCTVIVYFLFSVYFGAWHYSWLIFLWSSIGQIIMGMVKKVNRGKPLKRVLKSGLTSILWLITVILYILLSFMSGAWHLTWLIFPGAAIIQTFFSIFTQD
ncbi:MAG: hypothetical protein IJC71_02310 [Clostridia bacterium]|nr:hypothetical protein [Clostridia bacterium]